MRKNYFFGKMCLVSAISLLSFGMKAQTVVDGIAYKIVDGVAETSQLPGDVKYTLATINIPATVTIEGTSYAVKKIGDGSMRDNANLTSLTIAEGVETIGNSSFASCSAITNIQLPTTVKSIEDWAFYGCGGLESINIPDGITIINKQTFAWSGVTNIVLPASVTKIDDCAFQDAKKLSTINLENITEIGNWALYETAITTVDVSKVTTVGNEAFRNCANLQSITLEKAQTIGDWVFNGCNNLESAVIGDAESIGVGAFNACSKLETVAFGDVETIKGWAFQNCTQLASVDLGTKLKEIDGGTFSGCAALTTLTIPNTVTSIKDWSLEKTGITKIYASWADPTTVAFEGSAFGQDAGKIDFVWMVPDNLISAYESTLKDFPVQSYATTGIKDNEASKANASYANGSLSLTNLDGYDVNVVSLDGRVVASFQVVGATCEASVNLPSGIYLLNATRGGDKVVVKFIAK
ncbi:leucine-rich repeat domain-containing protein [Dysgonomonas sp. 520]|uniref:leucine-rich repeat domain-containing protein n=1 Tax=Dysgonomonas sp. 520 TaxID=2302931 RepID=UPI0013D1C6C5|nr:leucine-rich repeat domain-containing protein [Dysgonomonas sp. 520]